MPVTEMEKVTLQNAANAEESASAVEELSSQARELAAMASRFELGRHARTVRPASVTRAAPKVAPRPRRRTAR